MFDKLKYKIKKLLPKQLLYLYHLATARRAADYDLRRRVYDKVYNDGAAEKVKRDLTLLYHIVEKGLTMPVPRPGFGKKVVIDLCNVVLRYERMNLPQNEMEFVQSVTVLKEYAKLHQGIGYKLDDDCVERLNRVINRFDGLKGIEQIDISDVDYFKDINAPFDVFCRSRYSVRNYTDRVIPLDELYECIELAQKSPSFCNRQPTRVHIVKDSDKKQAILEIQNGNRGFGHLAETLIVLTSVISTTKDIHERFENHLNGGMFAMTLLNALHFKKIAACSLNWSVSSDKDMAMRKLLIIPENEVVLLVISCGYPPKHFKMAASPRKKALEITTEHV